jgi:orotidine-5'-phosphate decarboxylase
MTRAELVQQIFTKKSFLCVGLDPDLEKIPKHLLDTENPVLEFNKAIIEATAPYCVAYKPNLAFFEALGELGMSTFYETLKSIPKTHFVIADAKRGDIGNTSKKYAEAFYNRFGCDAITIAPYMGSDSVQPFLGEKGKWAILLALTSNPGADDFEQLPLANGKRLFEEVIDRAMEWGSAEELMFVVGATRPDMLKRIRERAPEYFFLIPGVGAQGGNLEEVAKAALTKDCGILVNASRSILYASSGADFAEKASEEAQAMQTEMAIRLKI